MPDPQRHRATTHMTTSVLIVEDQPEFLRRLSVAVLSDSSLALLGAVSTGAAGLAMLDAGAPDVMLVDLGLPDIDGIEVIRHAAKHHCDTDCLVVTMFEDDAHVLASIEAGATGYLLKDAVADDVCARIHELHAGGSPITPSIARRILSRFRSDVGTAADNAGRTPSPLSQREVDVLRLVAKGLSFTQVGDILALSPHTVVAHVKKIYRKLAVHSRGEAVYEANQMGLL